MFFTYLFLTGFLLLSSCGKKNEKNFENNLISTTNHWSEEAIWYQVFVERFRNGDPENDPNWHNMQGALDDNIPKNWSITPWGHNWYRQESWAEDTNLDFYRTIQMRRYGGDFQGVLDQLPYLVDLGINAIYFNPLNDAPSLHKFDARNYRHFDINFGPDPTRDQEIMAAEDALDPKTWKNTTSDSLFFVLLDQCHQKGIKVVVDFSWNHTGRSFWAFQDIVTNQKTSKYVDWYDITEFDDPNTAENEFDYHGWFNIKSLPELRKLPTTDKKQGHPYEGDLAPGPKQHIFNVAKRWMDPNGDGDPSDGIDGMRLDVAEHVPLGFWRDFRTHVLSINPDFYLVGENWWTEWPDHLMDPKPWLQGDVFDAVMHYHWYKPTRGFFAQSRDSLNVTQLRNHLDSIYNNYSENTRRKLMNLGASHDTPRLITSLSNRDKYKYKATPRDDAAYKINQPTEADYLLQKLFLTHQFTWISSPHIWNGDELGMWGADDPDNRKPLIWSDMEFENETPINRSSLTYSDEIAINNDIFQTYKQLIALRKNNIEILLGDYTWEDYGKNVLAYDRNYEGKTVHVVINNSEHPIKLKSTPTDLLYTVGKTSGDTLMSKSAVVYR